MRAYFFIIIFLIVVVVSPRPAQAVLPPSFIFDIGGQIFSVFSLVFAFLSSFFGIIVLYFRKRFLKNKKKRVIKIFYIVFGIVMIFSLSVGIAFFYNEYKQKIEYEEWLAKSEYYKSDLGGGIGEKINVKFGKIKNRFSYLSNYFGSEGVKEKNDDTIKFIYSYYEGLNKGNYDLVYPLSDKKISPDKYKEYYSQISNIEFDNIVRIDETRSSLELALYRGDDFEKYDVLLNLFLDEEGKPKMIKEIHSTLLQKGTVLTDNFYKKNYKSNLTISSEEFGRIIESGRNDFVVLDIREEFEYAVGGEDVPGVIRIRMSDLMSGRWLELPRDKFVYVFCGYGNLRSEDAVLFLRDKNILAFYLEGGLAGWKDLKNDYFSENEISIRNIKVLSTQDVLREKEREDTFVVSSNLYIKGFDFYVNYEMTTNEINVILSEIPKNSRIILLCHDTENCSTNQMIWIKIKDMGHEIVGLYNSPWEWEAALENKN